MWSWINCEVKEILTGLDTVWTPELSEDLDSGWNLGKAATGLGDGFL